MRVLVEQGLRRRHQREGVGFLGGPLIGGIEAAQAVDLVAEEIEPKSLCFAGREKVDQRPAHSIFAMLGDGVGALEAERIELNNQGLAVDPLTFRDPPRELADPERRQQPLSGAVDGGDQQLGLVTLLLEAAERRQPLGHHPQCRRRPVVR